MKRIVGLAIMLMMTVATFAKEVPLQVTETEWGFEISNVNAKGKKICTGSFSYDTENKDSVCFVFKEDNYPFLMTNFAGEYQNNKSLAFVQTRGEFKSGKTSDSLSIEKLATTNKILVVFTKGRFAKCFAYFDGKNIRLILSDYSEESETMLCKEIKELEKIKAEEAARIAAEKAKEGEFKKQKDELPALFAKNGKEGFDSMPWGTSIEFFLWLKPEANERESEGSVANYGIETEQNTKIYKFHEGKLVGGVTVYENIDDQTADDINHRLLELYGKASDAKDLGGHKIENVLGTHISYQDVHAIAIWNKSATFKIQLDVTAKQLDDYYGVMDKAMFNQPLRYTITYSNEKKMAAIRASDEKKKKNAEAEAQRKRMDNLGL